MLVFFGNACLLHYLYEPGGYGRCRVYELHFRPAKLGCYFAESIQQEGIVGAAQHYAVGSGIQQGLQAFRDHGFGFWACQQALFHQLHETFPDLFHYGHLILETPLSIKVFAAFQGPRGRKNAYDLALGAQGGGFDGRFHPYEGYGIFPAEILYAGGGSGVAGQHHSVGPA